MVLCDAGVNVSGDKLLVMITRVGDDIRVDQMTGGEITNLWKKQQAEYWNYIYREK